MDTLDMPRVFLAVAVMAAVTYLPRALPLILCKRRIQNRFIVSFLSYVPYAVLAAMTVPDILYSTASPISAAAGLAVAVFLAWRGKGLLPVALCAVAAVFLVERCLPLLQYLS